MVIDAEKNNERKTQCCTNVCVFRCLRKGIRSEVLYSLIEKLPLSPKYVTERAVSQNCLYFVYYQQLSIARYQDNFVMLTINLSSTCVPIVSSVFKRCQTDIKASCEKALKD